MQNKKTSNANPCLLLNFHHQRIENVPGLLLFDFSAL